MSRVCDIQVLFTLYLDGVQRCTLASEDQGSELPGSRWQDGEEHMMDSQRSVGRVNVQRTLPGLGKALEACPALVVSQVRAL